MGQRVKIIHLFLVFLFLITCGDTTSSSSSSKIIITSPDETGTVFVVGTKGAVPGEGTVTATNLSLSASISASFLETGCDVDSEASHTDGSFFALSLCAEVNHQIQIIHTDTNGVSSHVNTLKVPATISSSCTGEGERLFTVKNDSDEDIWLGITAGTISCFSDSDCPTSAAGSCLGADVATSTVGLCSCTNSSDECGTISKCNEDNKQCFWNLPELGVSQMNLAANGGNTVLCFPGPPAGKNIQWSGNMFARTGCNATGQACETGECGSAENGPCPTGKGGSPPATLLEFTLSNQTGDAPSSAGPDFYDISIIGGINLGMEMGPVADTFEAVANDPYSCKTPGSQTASGDLEACSWQVDPTVEGVNRTSILRNVKPVSFAASGTCPNGGTPNSLGFCVCTADANCSDGQFCGNALNASDAKFTSVCGNNIGWFTANVICGSSIDTKTPFGAPINCTNTVTNSDGSTSTYTNLHLCKKPDAAPNAEQAQSCYNDAAIEDCCGCATSASSPFFATWDLVLSPSFPGTDNGCFATNTNWENIAQPWLVFLKKACPTAYSYPFDDATSTFTCKKGSTKGPPAYELTFFSTE